MHVSHVSTAPKGAILAVDYALAYPGSTAGIALVSTPLLAEGSDARHRIEAEYGHDGRARLNGIFCRVHQFMGPLARPIARRARPDLPRAVAEDATRHTSTGAQVEIVDGTHHVLLENPEARRLVVGFVRSALGPPAAGAADPASVEAGQ